METKATTRDKAARPTTVSLPLVLGSVLLMALLSAFPGVAQSAPAGGTPQHPASLSTGTAVRGEAQTADRALPSLELNDLIAEALKNNPELLMLRARVAAQHHKVPQAKSLPDPMFMFGYQNEGFKKITIGEEADAMGMFSLSQMFPYPGKLDLKGKMALREAESTAAMAESSRLKIASRVVETYYDLFLAHKTIDIFQARTALFSQIEDAAAGRYASGLGPQQDVVMAQTEKYMILEREEMQRQRIQTLQGMLNATVGRDVYAPLGRPTERSNTPFTATFDEALSAARSHSPELKAKEKMVQAAEASVDMAKKEYYPDVTLAGSYFPKNRGLLDMWNVTATVNLPIFYRTKQRHGVLEAEAALSEARRDWKATDFMVAANVRENLSMVQAADRLMKLYTDALIPKTNQDVQLAVSGYMTGKTEAMTVITRLKGLLDVELLYWTQHVEREKAVGRLHAVTGAIGARGGQ